MVNVLHVWVNVDETLITVQVAEDTEWHYYEKQGKVVCVRRRIVKRRNGKFEHEIITTGWSYVGFTWASLVKLFQAHPQNWKNKQAVRMMRLYEEHRDYEAQKKAQKRLGMDHSNPVLSGPVLEP